MVNFNECVHAFIAAKYYEELTKAFGDRGKRAFMRHNIMQNKEAVEWHNVQFVMVKN